MGVFEVYQKPDVPYHRRKQQQAAQHRLSIRSADRRCDQVVEHDGAGKCQDIFRLAESVEHQ